jgi:phage host-nuclease inhibitor protein Gam
MKPSPPIGPQINQARARREMANPNGVTEKRTEKCIGAYELRESVERMAEVCWEARRAHVRSELDVSTTDMRCPLKWASLTREQQQDMRAEVIKYWGGAELPSEATIPDRIIFTSSPPTRQARPSVLTPKEKHEDITYQTHRPGDQDEGANGRNGWRDSLAENSGAHPSLERDERIKSIDDIYGPLFSEGAKAMEGKVALVQAWAEANPEEFGAKKSIETPHGIIGFRTGTPKLNKVARQTWETVKQAIQKRFGLKFIRTREDLDKEGIIAAHAAHGVTNERLAPVRMRGRAGGIVLRRAEPERSGNAGNGGGVVSVFVKQRRYWAHGAFPKFNHHVRFSEVKRCLCGDARREPYPFCKDCTEHLPAELRRDRKQATIAACEQWLRMNPRKGALS